ncbi:MAG: hypothetical protein H6633_27065 [Anaerolineales bacterium]|nr:hypothetical protein [Anaerolineales bacterium]
MRLATGVPLPCGRGNVIGTYHSIRRFGDVAVAPTGMNVGATAIGPIGGGNGSFNPIASPLVGGRGMRLPTGVSLPSGRGNVIGTFHSIRYWWGRCRRPYGDECRGDGNRPNRWGGNGSFNPIASPWSGPGYAVINGRCRVGEATSLERCVPFVIGGDVAVAPTTGLVGERQSA